MNAYLISEGGKIFITNADNLMDAENKFYEEFHKVGLGVKYLVQEVELSPKLKGDDSIVFF